MNTYILICMHTYVYEKGNGIFAQKRVLNGSHRAECSAEAHCSLHVPTSLSERNHVAVHRCDMSVLHVLDAVPSRPGGSFSRSVDPCLCSLAPLKQKKFNDASFTIFFKVVRNHLICLP